MSIPLHRQIRPGTLVSIVLKADQRTGRQVQGTVAQLLTRHDHPRGVKVRLNDGRIGRVQQLVGQTSNSAIRANHSAPQHPVHRTANMSSGHNPWATEESQGHPYAAPEAPEVPEEQYQPPPQPPPRHPQHQHEQQGHTNNPPAPATGVRRSDTDDLLAQQPDRGQQVEHMQAYEASAQQTQDDVNQAQLQKEFPNIDSSLIAAIYNDSKEMGSTREMLQELAGGS